MTVLISVAVFHVIGRVRCGVLGPWPSSIVSVTVPVSVSMLVSVAEFVSVSMYIVHDHFRFSVRVDVWAVLDCQQLCPCLFP